MNRTSKAVPTMKAGAKLMLTERGEIPANVTPEESRAFAMAQPVIPVATRNIPQADLARYADINRLLIPPPPRLRPERPSASNAPFQPMNRPQIAIDLTMDDLLDMAKDMDEEEAKERREAELYRFVDEN